MDAVAGAVQSRYRRGGIKMQIFKYLWIVILIGIYLAWVIHTFWLKKGMSLKGWWDNYGSLLFVFHMAILFFSSVMYYAYTKGGFE